MIPPIRGTAPSRMRWRRSARRCGRTPARPAGRRPCWRWSRRAPASAWTPRGSNGRTRQCWRPPGRTTRCRGRSTANCTGAAGRWPPRPRRARPDLRGTRPAGLRRTGRRPDGRRSGLAAVPGWLGVVKGALPVAVGRAVVGRGPRPRPQAVAVVGLLFEEIPPEWDGRLRVPRIGALVWTDGSKFTVDVVR